MTTPARKLVHWDPASPSLSDISSDSSDSFVSTSTLQYINSQLLAHGFVQSPGLSLDGVSNADMERIVKCLLELLGQRVKDMARTEELATELRTLSYDHQRLKSMHSAAEERAANFERETHLHKSRLQAVTKTLQTSEQAHKQTTAELQRTRGSLHAIRTTHQSELKKKEKEVEKMADKWAKISDMQARLSTAPSGFKPASSRIVSGNGNASKGLGFLEVAAQEAEKARIQITTECTGLKRVVLNAVNQLQQVLDSLNGTESVSFSMATLFPFCAPEHAGDKLASVLLCLRNAIHKVTLPVAASSLSLSEDERERMQSVIDALHGELDTIKSGTETQALLDKFAADPRLLQGHDKPEVSVELMTVPQHDDLEARLSVMRQELEDERARFTEATIQLGRERAAVEEEKKKLGDERRSWKVEQILSELPPTPAVDTPSSPPKPVRRPASPLRRVKSPRKSPARKATRVKKRSSVVLTSPKRSKVEPAYETEVLTERIAPCLLALPDTLLPTTFVLPPPSPQSAFPSSPPLPSILTKETLPTIAHASPEVQPFRHAYPFAQRMMHAYSPARPSPLSRILRLGDSPNDGPLFPQSDSSLESVDESSPFIDEPELSLAQELGIPDSPPRPVSPPQTLVLPKPLPNRAKMKAVVEKRFSASEKGKGKEKEKENVTARRERAVVSKPTVSNAPVVSKLNVSRARVMAKIPSGGGPRRVPVGETRRVL